MEENTFSVSTTIYYSIIDKKCMFFTLHIFKLDQSIFNDYVYGKLYTLSVMFPIAEVLKLLSQLNLISNPVCLPFCRCIFCTCNKTKARFLESGLSYQMATCQSSIADVRLQRVRACCRHQVLKDQHRSLCYLKFSMQLFVLSFHQSLYVFQCVCVCVC